jgi:endonuclease/exonuclease/phosphatase family metal-dependent hydrolase
MLKVMTFNIRYGLADDGPNRWDQRKPLLLARIQAFEPDLLGLQECRADEQAAFIQASLPEHGFFGVPRGGGGSPALEMAPVLWRTTAFERLQSGCFWLSETPDVPGSRSWGSSLARVVTWAELRHRPSGRSLTFACTHFDTEATAIDGAARALRRWVEQQVSRPMILLGDFNAAKDSFAYAHLTAGGLLADAYRQAHAGGDAAEATFHGYGQPGLLVPIDWILISPHFAVETAAVDPYHVGERYPSDHYPVTAELRWT